MIDLDKQKSESGFSLIECLIAMVITTVGLLAVAQLIVVGVRLQTESRDATAATALARAKMKAELDFRASGHQRRYAWDYDDQMELWSARR